MICTLHSHVKCMHTPGWVCYSAINATTSCDASNVAVDSSAHCAQQWFEFVLSVLPENWGKSTFFAFVKLLKTTLCGIKLHAKHTANGLKHAKTID